jgi:hypothetical protein
MILFISAAADSASATLALTPAVISYALSLLSRRTPPLLFSPQPRPTHSYGVLAAITLLTYVMPTYFRSSPLHSGDIICRNAAASEKRHTLTLPCHMLLTVIIIGDDAGLLARCHTC